MFNKKILMKDMYNFLKLFKFERIQDNMNNSKPKIDEESEEGML